MSDRNELQDVTTEPLVTDRLRELLAKATPGRWEWETYELSDFGGASRQTRYLNAVNGEWRAELARIEQRFMPDDRSDLLRDEDADLMVEAVNALPLLLDVVEALRRAHVATTARNPDSLSAAWQSEEQEQENEAAVNALWASLEKLDAPV